MQPIANLGSVQKAATYVLALAIILVRLEIAFGERIPLTFSLILSYGRDGYNSSGTIPAIDLALEHVNSLGVLGEYQLQYSSVKDSRVTFFFVYKKFWAYISILLQLIKCIPKMNMASIQLDATY